MSIFELLVDNQARITGESGHTKQQCKEGAAAGGQPIQCSAAVMGVHSADGHGSRRTEEHQPHTEELVALEVVEVGEERRRRGVPVRVRLG